MSEPSPSTGTSPDTSVDISVAVCCVTSQLSIAVARGPDVIAEGCLVRDGIDDLLVVMTNLLGKVGLKLPDVAEWIVLQGPGSYAGLRMGLSTIKTLALLSGARVKGLNTLEVMAYGVRWYEGMIVVAMEARKDELNFGLFGGGAAWNIVLPKEIIKTKQLESKLLETVGEFIIVGDWRDVSAPLRARFTLMHPRASTAIALAQAKPATELKRLNPIYSYPVNVTKPKKKI